jgi:NTE family protein
MLDSGWNTNGDAVFRGGGVKGLGLAGALLGFFEHGPKPIKKWVNVAGASAGAIIASYLAVGRDANDMVALLKKTQFGKFADFPFGGEYLGGIVHLLGREHGLARGKVFRDWMSSEIDHKTFAQVKNKEGDYRLKLIAVDVTNRTLLVLPDDLPRYRRPGDSKPIDPDSFEIADAARMSMSIPYFFEPVQLIRDRVSVTHQGNSDYARDTIVDRLDIEAANKQLRTGSKEEATFEEITDEDELRSLIVDGGTLSNFPVWLFDVDPAKAAEGTDPKLRGPQQMTFGFTLKGGRGVGAGFNKAVEHMPWPARFGFDIFHTAQDAWDARFVSHSTRVRTLAVDAGTVGTTDFNLDAKAQDTLVENGIQAAIHFLDNFHPEEYVNTYNATPLKS